MDEKSKDVVMELLYMLLESLLENDQGESSFGIALSPELQNALSAVVFKSTQDSLAKDGQMRNVMVGEWKDLSGGGGERNVSKKLELEQDWRKYVRRNEKGIEKTLRKIEGFQKDLEATGALGSVITKRVKALFGENPELEPFVMAMVFEISENKYQKGDWRDWKPKLVDLFRELNLHLIKLREAIVQEDNEMIKEFTADIANFAFFIAVKEGALEDDDGNNL